VHIGGLQGTVRSTRICEQFVSQELGVEEHFLLNCYEDVWAFLSGPICSVSKLSGWKNFKMNTHFFCLESMLRSELKFVLNLEYIERYEMTRRPYKYILE
jgi:hypothetical protein